MSIPPHIVVRPDVPLPWLNSVRGLDVNRDVSVRPSKCRMCQTMIAPGSARVAVMFYHQYKGFNAGGGSNKTKVFFHKDCWDSGQRERECPSCHERTNLTVQRTDSGLCIKCVLDPRIAFCSTCWEMTTVEKLSAKIPFEADPNDPWVGTFTPGDICERCERMGDVVTERSVLRKERSERAMMARLRSIQREVESWDYGEQTRS